MCCGNTNVRCTVLSCVVRIVLGEVELCRMHMPSASLVRAETVQILVTAVKGKSRCRWLLEEMQPRTSNGWTGPLDSVQFPIKRLGNCKHLLREYSYAAASTK